MINTNISIILGCLDYDVKFFNDNRIESIRIPMKRLLLLQKLCVDCCFVDSTPIFMHCNICRNRSKIPCRTFRSVRAIVFHIISQHKQTTPLSTILETLSAIEIFFLQKQGVRLEELNLL